MLHSCKLPEYSHAFPSPSYSKKKTSDFTLSISMQVHIKFWHTANCQLDQMFANVITTPIKGWRMFYY